MCASLRVLFELFPVHAGSEPIATESSAALSKLWAAREVPLLPRALPVPRGPKSEVPRSSFVVGRGPFDPSSLVGGVTLMGLDKSSLDDLVVGRVADFERWSEVSAWLAGVAEFSLSSNAINSAMNPRSRSLVNSSV